MKRGRVLPHGEPAVTIGAPVRRREDPRLLTGRGRYVGDVELPRLLHVAFVRSLHAHARVRAIDAATAAAQPGIVAVVTGRDPAFTGLCIRARSALPGYAETAQPVLAWPVARFAGEALAAIVGADRYSVEDAAGLVTVDYEPLDAAVDVLRATHDHAPRVHEEAPGNAYLVRRFQAGDVDRALEIATVVVERSFRTNRHCAAPLEGRASLAEWSAAEEKLTLWSATQVPQDRKSTRLNSSH